MQEFPPSPDKQVTRANFQESQAKMRWAFQHWRELYPTQRVARSAQPSVLPLDFENVLQHVYPDTQGKVSSIEKQLKALDVDGFLVLTRGRVACEEYFHGMKPETPHATMSVIKSIMATVIATLLDDGILKLDETIENYVPELRNTAYEGATVRQLLDMESGIKYAYVGTDNELVRFAKSVDPAASETGVPGGSYRYLVSMQSERSHGTCMRYKESDPAVLAWAAEKQTQTRFADLLQTRIWSQIGAEFDAEATCDQLGHWTFYLDVTLRDLGRWGQMCLNRGSVHGRQIIAPGFFDDIRQNASAEKLLQVPLLGELMPEGVGYRSFFYHQRETADVVAAVGGYGQFCYINASRQTVVAMLSTTPLLNLAGDDSFKQAFEQNCQLERERWHLCHHISRTFGES